MASRQTRCCCNEEADSSHDALLARWAPFVGCGAQEDDGRKSLYPPEVPGAPSSLVHGERNPVSDRRGDARDWGDPWGAAEERHPSHSTHGEECRPAVGVVWSASDFSLEDVRRRRPAEGRDSGLRICPAAPLRLVPSRQRAKVPWLDFCPVGEKGRMSAGRRDSGDCLEQAWTSRAAPSQGPMA